MKRALVSIATVVILGALLVPTALAGGPGPHATGGVTFEQNAGIHPHVDLSFTAKPVEGAPNEGKGIVQVRSDDQPLWNFFGRVTCYYQDGNQAWFAGDIEYGNTPSLYFLFGVVDNGEPGWDSGTPDKARIRIGSNPAEFDCSAPGSFNLDGPVLSGNLQVHGQVDGS